MEEKQTTPDAVPQWQLDLDKVGFVRKLFLARKWYGGDWWFVAISAVLLLFIILLGVAPQWFAPYDPRAEVGPALLAPGEVPLGYVLVVPTDSAVTTLKEIGSTKNNIGFVVGSAASQALRKTTDELNAAEKEAGSGIVYQPRPRRYETNELGLADLTAGKIDGFVASMQELEPLLPNFPGVKVAGDLSGNTRTFVLGTNQIGQDVLSRVIWGTRIALIVGLSSAIVAFLLGVPLGLISGFIGGPFDRVLTMLMDSLYSFPGLILAIAIAAVLGAGIGNVIVAIAVLYIPTYFRIVRGQTLSVKNDLYVEAARSLG
ncbi:MAG: ABC transporter permease, partial [Anaerolineaceae bacterium]